MTENLNNKLTFIDLFAGCGGLSLGMEQAGFYPLYVNELNSDALETYLINRDQEYPHLRKKYHSTDIKEIVLQEGYFDSLLSDFKKDFNRDFREDSVDLVAGGPPCQGYSGIGIRRSYSVDKKQLPSNHLYEDMAYVVHQVNPKMFLFENVEGLLRARWTKEGFKGEIFKDVLKTFKNLTNYAVKFKLVKAKDYGVPQNRPRVLVIGVRKDIRVKSNSALDALEGGFLPEPTNDYPNLEDVLSDLVDEGFEYGGESVFYSKKPSNSLQESYRTDIHSGSLMKKGHALTEMEYSKHSEKVVERFSHMIKNKGQIPEHLKTKKFAQRLLPRKWGEKGPTITVTSLPDDFVHYSQARCPTVREWARLQAFPDWYEFAGKRTTGGIRRAGNPRESNFEREVPKYTQIGNAVPVKLALEVGKHFKKLLNSK
jgi:DNA (cytosine-5)-methyltransferase 1